MVAVGLISYSLYLWHWPLLVLTRYLVLRDLLLWEKTALIAVSGLAAVTSWRYVEKPFRQRGKIATASLLRMGGLTTGLFIAVGAVGDLAKGLPQRFDAITRGFVEAKFAKPEWGRCRVSETAGTVPWCRVGANDIDTATFVLWGDSHAVAILPALDDIVFKDGRIGYGAFRDVCAPLVGVIMAGGATGRNCRELE